MLLLLLLLMDVRAQDTKAIIELSQSATMTDLRQTRSLHRPVLCFHNNIYRQPFTLMPIIVIFKATDGKLSVIYTADGSMLTVLQVVAGMLASGDVSSSNCSDVTNTNSAESSAI